MKSFVRFKFRFIVLSALLGLLISALFSVGGFTLAYANSKDSIDLDVAHPRSSVEIKELLSPVDAFYWNGNIAIVQSNSLLIYKDGAYLDPITLLSPQQVKSLGDDYVVVSQDGSLYTVDLNTHAVSALKYGADDKVVGCNNFDCNDDYIVTAYSQDLKIYSHNGTSVDTPVNFEDQTDLSSPVSINGKGEIFYVHNGKLSKCHVTDKTETVISNDKPTAILSDDNHIYYVYNNDVIKMDTDGQNKTVLSVSNKNADYDLGNLYTPTSISFKGENLLITDKTIEAVQEFSITSSETLEFTGFAIAKDKTAFNRTGDTAKAIDTYKNKIAVLDDFKLTVITKGDELLYDNFLQSALGDVDSITFGTDKILVYKSGTSSSQVRVVNLKDKTISTPLNIDGKITDVCFKNGKFYVCSFVASNVFVHVSSEEDLNFVDYCSLTNAYDVVSKPNEYPVMTVASDDTLYITHPAENKIYSFKNGSGVSLPVYTANGVIGLDTDLSGNLFCLYNDKVTFVHDDQIYTADLTLNSASSSDVTGFAIDENLSSVYFTIDALEGIFSTEELPIFAINKIITPDFKTKDSFASINDFKTYTTTQTYVDVVSPLLLSNGDYGFDLIVTEKCLNNEYLLICDAPLTVSFSGYTNTIDYCILAGHDINGDNAFIIANKLSLVDTTTILPSPITTAYVFSNVNMYYLPIISIENTFCLEDNDAPIRLTKGTELTVYSIVEFLDKEFYFASVSVSGIVKNGFIPKNFTVEQFESTVKPTNYSLEKIRAKTVAFDENGAELITFDEITTVRVYKITNDTADIEYFDNGVWVKGRIHIENIITDQNVYVRNAIIIIILTASAVATSLFFILRKKKS